MESKPVTTTSTYDINSALVQSTMGTSFNDAVSGQFRNKANSSDQDKKR